MIGHKTILYHTKQRYKIPKNSIVILQNIIIHETTLQHTKLHYVPYKTNIIILQNDITRQKIVL